MRKVVLYISMSLDGYIATANGDTEWLSMVESPYENYGYDDFIRTIDTVIFGRKTYERAQKSGMDLPHLNKKCFVMTPEERPPEGNIIFYNGEPSDLIKELKHTPGENIFCNGGDEPVKNLIKHDLIDEYCISVLPLILGNGLRLFDDFRKKIKLKLLSSKSFPSGLVQIHYRRLSAH